jgi:hypothetical protein
MAVWKEFVVIARPRARTEVIDRPREYAMAGVPTWVDTIFGTMGTQPPFVFEAQPSREQVVAAIRYASRKTFWFFRIFGLVVFLYGLGGAIFDDGPVWFAVGIAIFFALLGAVVAVFLPWFTERRATRTSMKMVGMPTAYRVDAEGVRSANALTDGVIRWPLISRIDEVSGLVMVRLGKARFIPIPAGDLPAETRIAMVDFLRANVAASGADANANAAPNAVANAAPNAVPNAAPAAVANGAPAAETDWQRPASEPTGSTPGTDAAGPAAGPGSGVRPPAP